MTDKELKQLDSSELVEALIEDTSLASDFDRLNLWDEFDFEDWVELLSEQPQFDDKCNKWNEFNSYDWLYLLSAHPQFADKCTEYKGWEKIDSCAWRDLLKSQPQLWIYCPKESVKKIKEDPTKAKDCKCWDWFNSKDWLNLLSAQPQFTNKYNKWDEFDSSDWSKLLSAQPQVADKCSEFNGWRKLSLFHWNRLLSFQPQFADKFKKWRWFNSSDWSKLLSAQPQFADKCKKWDKFDSFDWGNLLSYQPQFADKCNKWDFSIYDWYEILKREPQLIKKCNTKANVLRANKFDENEEQRILSIDSNLWKYLPYISTNEIIKDSSKLNECECVDKLSILNWENIVKTHPTLKSNEYYQDLLKSNLNKSSINRKVSNATLQKLPKRKLSRGEWRNLIDEDIQIAYLTDEWQTTHSRGMFDNRPYQNIARMLVKYPELTKIYKHFHCFDHLTRDYFLSCFPEYYDKCSWDNDDKESQKYKIFKNYKLWWNVSLRTNNLDRNEEWANLLEEKWTFQDEVWLNLIRAQPQFANKCNKWGKFNSWNWSDLLSDHPQFADKCTEYKGWERFDSSDWSKLLSAQPQFADNCPDKIYDQFTQEQWDELEAKHPGVFEDRHMLSTLRKLAK